MASSSEIRWHSWLRILSALARNSWAFCRNSSPFFDMDALSGPRHRGWQLCRSPTEVKIKYLKLVSSNRNVFWAQDSAHEPASRGHTIALALNGDDLAAALVVTGLAFSGGPRSPRPSRDALP